MSDTPTTDRIIERGVDQECILDRMKMMERHLRKLLAMANCYVPANILKEVQDFLSDNKPSVN